MGNWSVNARDGALSVFFSYGSTNRLGGCRESDLDALRVGWEEQLFHFCFPSIGGRFIVLFFMHLKLVTIGFRV